MKKINRRSSRVVRVGSVAIGGSAPVSIQSMTKTLTSDTVRTVRAIKRLEEAGCEIARVAVRDSKDADGIKDIKRSVRIPIVADIHFDYRLALLAMENGADKIRINPANISRREELLEIARRAKQCRIPIRLGLNSGSTPQRLLVSTALEYIKIFEETDFRDIIVSLKASDVVSTVGAYRELAGLCDYPLHLGVTASGLPQEGIVKSAIGIGALLLDGIGDTIRVSLTASPEEEVLAAKRILGALGIRRFGPEIISCPTCGRCQVDLIQIVHNLENELKRATSDERRATRSFKIAVMGCEVNGPGEAKEADIGIAAGKGCGALFRKGRIIRRIREKDFVKELLREIKRAR